MKFSKTALLALIITVFQILAVKAQRADSTSFSIDPRMSFYSFEKKGELLLKAPVAMMRTNLLVIISEGKNRLGEWEGRADKSIIRIPVDLGLPAGDHRVIARISSPSEQGIVFKAAAHILILRHKANEVKTDNLTGGVVVNKLQFYPFGFYCYSPVSVTLPEEEIVKGFNMISPYQTILPETLGERKAYMDRCAQIGMKVHYNLLSLSGGGGSDPRLKDLSPEEKRKRLIEEIKTFMDHPALLAWYISDEPNGYRIPPEKLEEVYRVVKETDPWHPVSMVFMVPFSSAGKYSKALDIAMADPYPVPSRPIRMVGDVTSQLKVEFGSTKPVWMVIRSFGGGEWWEREPSPQEVRSMTWQAIIKGAAGIQYFVRQGPNYFPKSVAAWNECAGIAMEVSELTPWLLSDEAAPEAASSGPDILMTSKVHNGQLLVAAVNRINEPLSVDIRIKGIATGRADLIFENRSVKISGGRINDRISPFGSLVYLVHLFPPGDKEKGEAPNLLKDSGFENLISPGVPSACYARPGGDRGATYFTDTHEVHSGNHSLKLITPVQDKCITIRMFPFQAKAGSTYAISLWAKNDPEQREIPVTSGEKDRLYKKDKGKQYIEILFGSFGCARFAPDSVWRRYMSFMTIPQDTSGTIRTNLIVRMPGQGVAWIDDLKVFEERH